MGGSRVAKRAPASRLQRLATPRKHSADRSFEQLYNQHAREVYQYALAVLANPADAEDVTQTTFLNAYRAFQRGERPQRPHNWLIAIAHNVCRMRWRQATSRPSEVALEDAPEPATYDHETPDLDEVLQALAQLSFNQRAALVMRELEGRTYREIADVLDLSVGAVEALLFRARQRLRVHRRDLGVLTTIPLPGSLSLSSLLGAGGGGAAAGGAALGGADVVLKAAAIAAAGALTAGVGYKSVEAVAGSSRSSVGQAQRDLRAAQPPSGVASPMPRRLAGAGPVRSARANRRFVVGPGANPAEATPASHASAAAPAQSAVAHAASTAAKAVAPVTSAAAPVISPVTQVVTTAKKLVAPAPPPALPPVPPLPVTVTAPTLPLPPPIGK